MPRLLNADCPYSRKFDKIDVANAIRGMMKHLLANASACKHIFVAIMHQEGVFSSICSTGRPPWPSFTDMDQSVTFGTSTGTVDKFSMNMHRPSDTNTPLHVPDPRHEPLSGMVCVFARERLGFSRLVSLMHNQNYPLEDKNPHISMNIHTILTLSTSFSSS